jgi:hypothetical protein
MRGRTVGTPSPQALEAFAEFLLKRILQHKVVAKKPKRRARAQKND